jgi:hypothetical protein
VVVLIDSVCLWWCSFTHNKCWILHSGV